MLRFKRNDGTSYPEWKEKTLGELGTFAKGAPLSKADIADVGTPLILYGELYTTYSEVAYDVKRKTLVPANEKYYSKAGDVLIPTSGESPEEISTATCVMVPGVILGGDLNIYRSNIVDGRVMSYIINHQAKDKIARIAQGKSIVHLQARELKKTTVRYPTDIEEQKKIADFLFSVDEVITESEKEIANLEEQKKGAIQKIFSQEVRFRADDGSEYPEWENTSLGEVFIVSTEKNNNTYTKNEVLSVSDEYGVVNQIAFQGRSYAGEDISNYKIVKENQIIYTRSPLAAKPFGIIKIVKKETGIVSPLYIVNTVNDDNSALFMYYYFDSPIRTNNYLKPLVRMGPKNTMNISNEEWLSGKITVPCLEEQQKIADFLSSFDEAIDYSKQELETWKAIKKGLLQQMFE